MKPAKNSRSSAVTSRVKKPFFPIKSSLKLGNSKSWLRVAFIIGLSLLVVLPLLPMIASHHKIGGFDWDIFTAYYEAIRRTILVYHQFPWWNPWIYGGVPLFANPQNSPISLQLPLILVFGTIWGIKLSLVAYFLAGFWGMYWLLKGLNTGLVIRLLLSYVWIFSTYVTFHLFAGHYTFASYLLSPWLFLLAHKIKDGWKWVLAFGLFLGFFINSNLHYLVVQAIFLLSFWLIGEVVVAGKNRRRFLLKAFAATSLGAILAAPKLYFEYSYVKQFPSPSLFLIQQVTSLRVAARAFLWPWQQPATPFVHQLVWWEISSYIGLGAVILFGVAALVASRDSITKKRINLGLIFFIATLSVFAIGLGPFARFSPYSLLSKLPVFSAMQVPSRWFGWCLFFMVLTISQFKKFPKIAAGLLVLSVLELIRLQPLGQAFPYSPPPALAHTQFEEYDNLRDYIAGTSMGSNMYQATISNYGEIRGYEPIIDRATFGIPSARCGINTGCQLVSDNATVVLWSPNIIKLRRKAPGPISLNINPSSYWLVNGQRLFASDRVTEPNKKFVITTPASNIELKIDPL